MNGKCILSELERLKDKLITEYDNSDINFEVFFKNLKEVLLKEKIRCIFLHKDGMVECRHLYYHEIMPYYKLAVPSIGNLVKLCSDQDGVTTSDLVTKTFKYKEIDECIFYIEETK